MAASLVKGPLTGPKYPAEGAWYTLCQSGFGFYVVLLQFVIVGRGAAKLSELLTLCAIGSLSDLIG
jgi:hypothetical protein